MKPRAIGVPGAPTGAPLSGLKANDTHGTTRMSTNFRSIDGCPMAVALAAGLTPQPRGDQAPDNAAYSGEGALPGGPGSTGPARPDGQPLLRPLSERPGPSSPARSGRVGPAVPLPRHPESGRYFCCGGYGEHFLFCDEAAR